MTTTHLFTSESVCAGHPDKLSDQISDAILDHLLATDDDPRRVRCAIETLVTRNRVVIAGEYNAARPLDDDAFRDISRTVIRDLGYTDDIYGFTDRSPIDVYVQPQSRDIANMVDDGGAGDQGLMFGYAVDHSRELMPLPIVAAHLLARGVDALRTSGTIRELRPDGKTQVTVRYENGRPVAITRIVVSVPHDPALTKSELKERLWSQLVLPTAENWGVDLDVAFDDFIVNGSGEWEIGGPASDTGLTGRKIIVDTYGGAAPHGGGAFSGKEASKVDRSAAYMARHVARSIVASGLANECTLQVAYAIGLADPLSLRIDTRGTGKLSDAAIETLVRDHFSFRPNDIIDTLDLTKPRYRSTAAYGHFGRNEFPWEKTAQIKW